MPTYYVVCKKKDEYKLTHDKLKTLLQDHYPDATISHHTSDFVGDTIHVQSANANQYIRITLNKYPYDKPRIKHEEISKNSYLFDMETVDETLIDKLTLKTKVSRTLF